MTAVLIFIALVPFYFLGCFPTGKLVSKLHGVDIASQGSGNVGATNVARVIGKQAGILTLLGDVAKGGIGVGVAQIFTDAQWFVMSAAVFVVLGHCLSLPPYLKGGKGVATALGTVFAVTPIAAVASLVVFGGVFGISRLVSLASITATISVPLYCLVTNAPESTSVGFMAMAFIIVVRHEQNIARLIRGTEPKFSTKKT
jgi:glycerol-3-phosphate acyltransferase PlsY